MIYQDLTQLVGHTPLLSLHRMAAQYEALAQVVAKVESFNPGGSVKDRVALSMIEDAEARGILQPGGTIIEPTSGNTGVGLAWISRVKGYDAVIVMPDSMSMERQSLLRASGARLVLTPGALGIQGAIDEAQRLCDTIPGAVILGQFANPANPRSHRETTAQELLRDTDFTKVEDGRYELDGENLFYFIQTYENNPANETPEAHKKYIDIQCVLTGKERMDVGALEDMTEEVLKTVGI